MGKSNILLEAGTNEMELLVFRLKKSFFGVNVAKVREIIQRLDTIQAPHSHPIVEGVFRLREEVFTLINIGKYFEMEGEETQSGGGLIIILEFNKFKCGVLVDAVEVIHRLGWQKIETPPEYIAQMQAPITGVVKLDLGVVLIADFESIVGETIGTPNESMKPMEKEFTLVPEETRILFADDSPVIRMAIEKTLREANFNQLTICNDGEAAWNAIVSKIEGDGAETPFDIVLTDIEMPKMDGWTLTKNIKNMTETKAMPVVIFSSLVSDTNLKKGQQVGADAQVTKFEGDTLLRTIEEQVARYRDT